MIMRLPRIAVLSVSVTLAGFIALLTGCGKSRDEAPGATTTAPTTSGAGTPAVASSGSPVVIITQTPEFPKPGQYVQYPRGLVGALWSDGRIVRCVDPLSVGKSYISGKVSQQDRDEFLAFLKSDEVMKAPKIPHLRLHAATLQTTVRTESGKEKWVAEVPDDKSIWVEVRKRLLNLPVAADAKAADESAVQDATKEE
jgi:hypothetical protein